MMSKAKANACEKVKRTRARREAARELNTLLEGHGLTELTLRPKAVDLRTLGRALRVLERRCTDRVAFRAAVDKWVLNGGKLPAGIDVAELDKDDDEETSSVVPGHRVLLTTHELKSQAFMLTYNSRKFTMATSDAFRVFVEGLHAKHGSKAWSACLEESLNASTTTQKRYHTHAYMLWSDGIGYRSESLDEFVFERVRPRVDKCVAATNTRQPRRSALHGLWYVYIKTDGTVWQASNWTPWVDYVPSGAWLVRLWEHHKLSHESYLEYSALFRSGHTGRRKDVIQVKADVHAAAVRKHVRAELSEVEKLSNTKDVEQVHWYISGIKIFL